MTNEAHRYQSENTAKLGQVAVLYGGQSAEREISILGGKAVLLGLQEAGVDAIGLDVGDDWMERLEALNVDRAFIQLHGSGGEDGVVQGLLETMGLPYTGSGVQASALAMDKIRCKQYWLEEGIATPPFAVLESSSDWAQILESLGGSVMVKPASEGSSLGMSKAETASELAEAWHLAAQFDAHVLAEQWLSGAEYTVAILNDSALPTIKLETEREFYDYQAKYIADDTRYLCPCGLSAEQDAAMQALAVKAYKSLGCRAWGRVDLMIGGDGQIYVLEVNTVPGMTDHSLVPMAAVAAGMSFAELVVEILLGSMAQPSELGQ